MVGNGMIGIRVGRGLQVEPIPSLRAGRDDPSGQRPGTYVSAGVNAQLDANRNIGTYIQAQVVQRMRNHIASGKRASASTGRLVNATSDARNVIVTKEFIGVGVPDFLSESEAKYWRIFEEGTHGFVGTILFGLKGAPFPVAHGAKPGIRTMSPGRLEELLSGEDEDGPGRKSSGNLFVVQHEIQPANIYRDVAREFSGSIGTISMQFARRVLQEAVREIVVAGPPAGAPSASQQWYR